MTIQKESTRTVAQYKAWREQLWVAYEYACIIKAATWDDDSSSESAMENTLNNMLELSRICDIHGAPHHELQSGSKFNF